MAFRFGTRGIGRFGRSCSLLYIEVIDGISTPTLYGIRLPKVNMIFRPMYI